MLTNPNYAGGAVGLRWIDCSAAAHRHMLTCALPVQVESYFFDIRRQLFEYDQVMNTQRDKVYGERRRALLSADLSGQMVEYAEKTVDDILEVCLS